MSAESHIGQYTHEDIRQIAGGDDGFSFKGPEEHDPLGPLFAEIQNGDLLGSVFQQSIVQEKVHDSSNLSESTGSFVLEGVEVKL